MAHLNSIATKFTSYPKPVSQTDRPASGILGPNTGVQAFRRRGDQKSGLTGRRKVAGYDIVAFTARRNGHVAHKSIPERIRDDTRGLNGKETRYKAVASVCAIPSQKEYVNGNSRPHPAHHSLPYTSVTASSRAQFRIVHSAAGPGSISTNRRSPARLHTILTDGGLSGSRTAICCMGSDLQQSRGRG